MFNGIYGHKKQTDFLQKSIESAKMAHAYLFSGPAFVGKRMIAKNFAKELLGFQGDFHPDLLEVHGSDTIKIEEIRDLIYKLSLKPYQAKYKVAIIDNAENMTVDAQNSLLKSLEEPKPYNVIILITSNPGKLLRTISSRAQKINFGPVPSEEYKELIPSGTDAEVSEMILTLAAGRPGLAVQISKDDDLVERIRQIDRGYSIIKADDLPEKLKLAYDLADLETEELRQVLDFWMFRFEQALCAEPNSSLAKNIVQVNKSRRYLEQNVNSKLLLTNLMLNLV